MAGLIGVDRIDEMLRLPDGTTATADDGGRLVFASGARRFAIGPLRPRVIDLLRGLAATGATREGLTAAGDAEAALQLDRVLERLGTRGWIERTVRLAGSPLASLRPGGTPLPTERRSIDQGACVALSRFALMRNDNGELVVESPRSTAAVVLHDLRAVTLTASLAKPRLAAAVPAELPSEAREALVGLLADAGLLVDAAPDGTGDEEQELQALAQWSVTDLTFHATTRYGRRSGGYGGTFPLQGRFDPLPERTPLLGRSIALARPDLARLCAGDPPFSAVLARRRSIRKHDDRSPITREQLGDFLYRSAGARSVPGDGPCGSQGGTGTRPYPTGGGLYELELYPVVNRCEGLEPALYHYDPVDHRLGLVAGMNPAIQRLLDDGRARSLMDRTPQVLVVVAARFGRVMFKYEAIAYAVILKNVGALYQTMYCVATAMGLAPCALGGGSADSFCAAAGLDYYVESSVGEFLIGSAADEPAAALPS